MPHTHQPEDSTSTLEYPTLVSEFELRRYSSRSSLASPAHRFSYRYGKRLFDIFLVLLFLPILFIVMAAVCVLIKLTSPGPIFFTHRRLRRNGAFFSMWKFRTMCQDSSEVLESYLATHPELRDEWNRNHKLKEDPRVTAIGKYLRKTSIDELPQVLNVLSGKMSLVGPRPIQAAEVEKYGDDFTYYCAVKPGVAGLWQASGRSTTSYARRVALDRYYVENWSFWLDIKILFMTAKSVATGHGAY